MSREPERGGRRLPDRIGKRAYALGAFLAVAVSGCGGGGASSPQNETVSASGQYRSLRFTVSAQKYHRRGAPIPLTFTVQNVGGEPVTVSGFASPEAEVRQRGEIVWRLSRWQRTHLVRGPGDWPARWTPGAATTYDAPFAYSWPQTDAEGRSVPPGTYTVEASLPIASYNEEDLPQAERENTPRSLPIEITIF